MDGFQSSTILFLKFRASIFSVSTLCLSVRGPRFTVLYCITNWKLYFTGSGCVWQTVTLSAAAVIFMIKLTAECSDGRSCVTLSAAAVIFMIKIDSWVFGWQQLCDIISCGVDIYDKIDRWLCGGQQLCDIISSGGDIYDKIDSWLHVWAAAAVWNYQLRLWYLW